MHGKYLQGEEVDERGDEGINSTEAGWSHCLSLGFGDHVRKSTGDQ